MNPHRDILLCKTGIKSNGRQSRKTVIYSSITLVLSKKLLFYRKLLSERLVLDTTLYHETNYFRTPAPDFYNNCFFPVQLRENDS